MIVVIGGATATGKSSLAVEIAKRFNGEIISADSMQIYKGMDIGTAKVTPEEMQGVPHHLIDIVSPKDEYNVAIFVEDAQKAVSEIEKKGKLPIMVGGTGLYIKSFLYNYSHGAFDMSTREELMREAQEKGGTVMWEKLRAIDPIAAEKIHPNNQKRVMRALEVVLLTGRSITEETSVVPRDHALICIDTDRKTLYERIDKRVDEMFDRGLVTEIEGLLEEGVDFTMQSMQAIGYKEFKGYFGGEKTLEEVKEEIKINSRHYAKRQETWFKRMETAEWYKLTQKAEIFDKIEQTITK